MGRPRKKTKLQNRKLKAICATKEPKNKWFESGLPGCARTVRNQLTKSNTTQPDMQ